MNYRPHHAAAAGLAAGTSADGAGRRGAATATVLLLAALPATAHVEVQPGTAPAGAPATFSFRVPNEKDNAATVALAVHFPSDHPIATIEASPKDGWTAQVTMRTLPSPAVVTGAEPAHPAAVLQLTGAKPVVKPATTAGHANDPTTAPPTTTLASGDGGVPVGAVVAAAIVAIVGAVLALRFVAGRRRGGHR